MLYDKGASISFIKMEQPRTNQWNVSKYSCSRKSLCSPGKLLSSRGRVWRCDYTWHTTQNTQGDYLNPWHMPVDGVIESVDGEDSRRKDVNSDEVDAVWNICVRIIMWVKYWSIWKQSYQLSEMWVRFIISMTFWKPSSELSNFRYTHSTVVTFGAPGEI